MSLEKVVKNHSENAKGTLSVNNLTVQFRCPSCQKLYQTMREDLISEHPHFDCPVCHAEFVVDCEEGAEGDVEVRLVRSSHWQQIQQRTQEAMPPELKKCPKCDFVNLQSSTECMSCGVVFAKWNEPKGLEKEWLILIQEFENQDKHMEFWNRCKKLNSQSFALKKYQELKSVQPDDILVQNMLKKITRHERVRRVLSYAQAIVEKINWTQVIKWGPYVVGVSSIILGLVSASQRQFVSFGVSLLLLAVGLSILIRGRVA